MESIILNSNKLAAELFWAFSKGRTLNGMNVGGSVGTNKFSWHITENSKSTINEPKIPTIPNPLFEYSFSRDSVDFRSSDLKDHYRKLSEEFNKFQSEFDAFNRMKNAMHVAIKQEIICHGNGEMITMTMRKEVNNDILTLTEKPYKERISIEVLALGTFSVPAEQFFEAVSRLMKVKVNE